MTDRCPAVRKRGRPRSADVDARAMAAALALFSLKGWAGFTIDETAKRACLGKATIYLRWQDGAELLIEALRWADRNWPVASSGKPDKDLVTTLVAMIRRFTLPQGWALHCSLLDPALPQRVRACTLEIAEARLTAISELLYQAGATAEPDKRRATMLVGAAMSFAGAKALAGRSDKADDTRDYAREVIAVYSATVLTGPEGGSLSRPRQH